ncbi:MULTISPECIES: hypothetical protein [unclassified Micromonospora]|uniref:hypothetical protein n=1 Tax=unclassified Micromonospora TaxID=2617518 RepID=UPI00340E8773
MSTDRTLHRSRHLDVIVFLAVLATGILLTLIGTPTSDLVTIATALSGLYHTWNTRRLAPLPSAKQTRDRTVPADPKGPRPDPRRR